MYAEVDVFISNYTLLDPDIYQLWIEGYASSEAVSILKQNGVAQQTGAPLELIASDVLDHYRTYSLLERLLTNPAKLSEQPSFQLEPQTRSLLIAKYYSLDDMVVRELLGKKLSSRHRKDLDEVSEKTGVRLKSCRRQFDNVKRVFKTVEEMPGCVATNVKSQFLLPDDLAKTDQATHISKMDPDFVHIWMKNVSANDGKVVAYWMKYAAIVFIACLRFETSKRRLQYLTFSDLFHCAQSVMGGWTYMHTGPEYYDTEMDREFLLDLREVKVLLDREKDFKHLVCVRLKYTLLERSYQELENNFRSYSRSLISLGCGLHRTRELRNLFIELSERLVEPWKTVGWAPQEVKEFLTVYTQAGLDLDALREADLRSAWERYMKVISVCITKMYHT